MTMTCRRGPSYNPPPTPTTPDLIPHYHAIVCCCLSSIQAFFVKKKRVSSEIDEQTSFEITPSPSTCATGSVVEIKDHTVLADETTDISQIEQFSLCVRYVDEELFKIREDFLAFVPVYDVTGQGIKEETPRTCRKQTNRCNTPYTNVEEYYRRVVYIPYLDDFCCSLQERFKNHREVIDSLQNVLPEHCIKTEFSSLEPALTFYEKDLSFRDEQSVEPSAKRAPRPAVVAL
ncbi:hypothetical protein J6590_065414 [Homalodisca vitripennis]|nr:hypothetical protein J6590_065414 [Homalodisca vitripennis]